MRWLLGIPPEQSAFYANLFEIGLVEDLVDRGLLVPTWPTEFKLDNFGLIVKHKRFPFVSYPFEWSREMLKQSALNLIDLEIALSQHNLGLQDPNPWKVLFDGPRPVFVDFGSIVPEGVPALWEANGEFFRFMVYPLQASASGHERVVRWLLRDHIQGLSQFEADTLIHRWGIGVKASVENALRHAKRYLPANFHSWVHKRLTSLDESLSGRAARFYENRNSYLRRLRSTVEEIRFPMPTSRWSPYYDGYFPSFTPSAEWSPKHHSVYEVLTKSKPKTVIDLGSNRGWYAQLAARLGSLVVAIDYDEIVVDRLFHDARRDNLYLLPLVMDVRNPSPASGLCSSELGSATERLKCDLGIAMALIHHLVFDFRLTFDQVVNLTSAFTERALLIEFVSREDQWVGWRFKKQHFAAQHSWYTLKNFQDSLARKYRSISVLPSETASRQLLLCEK
jgi:SAM-dependent methyltransferase